MPVVGCSETTSSNSFGIVRDGQKQSYDRTTIRLNEMGPQLVLWGTNTLDPLPNAADDEDWDDLRVVFDKDGLAKLATDQDYPISGEASGLGEGHDLNPNANDVTFTGTGLHTAAIEQIFFARYWWGCYGGPWAQSIEGTLHLSMNTTTRLRGVIEVRVEGDVPCTENTHQFYDLTLMFDLVGLGHLFCCPGEPSWRRWCLADCL
jgi:hypothetical protein